MRDNIATTTYFYCKELSALQAGGVFCLNSACHPNFVVVQGGYQAPPCARTCHEEACTDFKLHYGKFCGVGHGGCPGELA